MNTLKVIVFITTITASLVVLSADMTAEQWKAHMERALPKALCVKESNVRVCLSVTDDQCLSGLAKTTRVCIGKMKQKIPEIISMPKVGEALGGDVGGCAEDLFVIENAKTLKSLPQCAEYRQIVEKSKVQTK
jgi:hypothetical protein